MAETVAPCIYCGREFNPKTGEGDHVLPARLFGEFEGDKTFRGICVTCNNGFGRFEQLLCQGSPLGLYRWVVNPNLGRRSGRGSLRQRGAAHGTKRPKFTMRFGDRTILVDPSAENPLDVTPVNQLAVTDKSGQSFQIQLFGGMSADRLKEELERQEVQEIEQIWYECDLELTDQFRELITEVFPKARVEEEGITEAGNYRLEGRAEFQFSIAYFQAVAKMAFHYYLLHNQSGAKGTESRFDELRNFIVCGGEKDKFFQASGKRFATPFGEVGNGNLVCPQNWSHILAVNEVDGPLVVFMQFFVGPGSVPAPHYVTLSSDCYPGTEPGVWGHVYQYEPGRTGRFAGRVTTCSFTKYDPKQFTPNNL